MEHTSKQKTETENTQSQTEHNVVSQMKANTHAHLLVPEHFEFSHSLLQYARKQKKNGL